MKQRFISLPGLLLLPLLTCAQAPPAARAGQAQLVDCVRELGGDSVALYYDAHYALTPAACATTRRVAHFDPKSDFNGAARDYQLSSNRLLYKQYYEHGVRQGTYEAYYPNGQLQVRGAFSKGDPSGEWQFWYASGKPWQILRWDGAPQQPWRFVAYWDASGQPLLTNGTGRWQQVQAGQHLRLEGAVLNELPAGEWQLYQLGQQKLLTTETYEQGKFKKGHNWVGLGPANYHDKPRLLVSLEDPSAEAERFQLGSTCEELTRRAAFIQSEMQKGHFQTIRTGDAKSIVPARPDGDASTYLRLLLQKLSATTSMSGLLLNPQYTAEVDADIDEFGKLGNFRSAQPIIQSIFMQIVPPLGRWHAATASGQPARSHVRFQLSVLDQQWQVRYHTSGVELALPHPKQP